MPENITKEYALANIVRVDLTLEEGAEPTIYKLIDVATEADVVAFISAGQEQELRVKNTIKAQNNTEDIVKGYDIRLLNATMVPEILATVDGGTWDPTAKKYSAPVVGQPVKRKVFKLDIYTEEKDADGSTLSYVKFTYLNSKGTPVNYTKRDGEFFSPELNIKSRPKMGESPATFEILDELPA